MADERGADILAPLRERAVLQEHQFTSHVPLIGGLIAAFRRAWNNISTRWYVSPILQQQSAFNQLAVEQLAELVAQVEEQAAQLAQLQRTLATLESAVSDDRGGLQAQVAQLQAWFVAQDHAQVELRHDLGELAVLFRQQARRHEQPLGPGPRAEAGRTDEPAA